MILNVIHRADKGKDSLEGLKFQQGAVHNVGFKVTILMSYGALFDKDVVDYVKTQKALGDEVGIHLHEIMCEDMSQYALSLEPAIYLHTEQSKKNMLKRIFERFLEVFDFIPVSIGGYIIDGQMLRILEKEYPTIKTAITNCFEEGIKMYEGNNRSWYLFSDGGPWGPYYPSRKNFLCPASSKEESVDIVGLPHLNRDMVLSLTSRDDYFASHPINVVRAKVNDGPHSRYMLRFIDQWINQEDVNGYSYYSLFVSTPWVNPGNIFVDSWQDARALYVEALEHLKKRCGEGKVVDMTMAEFGTWFRANRNIGQSDVNLWDDILCGTKRQNFWYIDDHFRVTIDMNSGGKICDFRIYEGKLNLDQGPETNALYNGNYPFDISTEHRPITGLDCLVTIKGKHGFLSDKRVKGSAYVNETGLNCLIIKPITLKIDDVEVTIQSTFTFQGNGRILIERKILSCSKDDVVITLANIYSGSHGESQYPEDLRDVQLSIEDIKKISKAVIDYSYMTRDYVSNEPGSAIAVIPSMNSKIILYGETGKLKVEEGCLFKPNYQLIHFEDVQIGGALRSCLITESL